MEHQNMMNFVQKLLLNRKEKVIYGISIKLKKETFKNNIYIYIYNIIRTILLYLQTYYILLAIGSFFDFDSVTLPLLDKGTQIAN